MILHHPAPGYSDTAYERAIGAPAVPGPIPGPAPHVTPPWPPVGGPTPSPQPAPGPGPGASTQPPQPTPQPTPNPRPGPGSVSGQAIVGQQITSAWWQGSYEITQGYGATDFDREPPGHGQAHWHAGVDVGIPCGTEIDLPSGIAQATVSAVDNPGGYGTALVVHLQGYDVWLGHLRQRLVADGASVKAGDKLAISNNTGNSTGCHVHFEVRKAGGSTAADNGSYGSDVDPTELLTAGVNTQTNLDPLAGLEQAFSGELASAEQTLSRTLVAGGAVVLGTVGTLGGLGLVAYGMAGGSAAGIARAARGQGRRPATGRQAVTGRAGRRGAQQVSSTQQPAPEARVSPRGLQTGSGQVRRGRLPRQAAPKAPNEIAALRAEIRAAQAARRAARPGGPAQNTGAWTDATVRLNMARNRLAQLQPASAAAARVRR